MTDCLFCKIAQGEIPATVVKETADALAFRDVNPQAPTHVLVIPKHHVESLNTADSAELLGHILLLAREVAEAEGIGTGGYRVVINTNADGGQTVFHIHAHLLGGRPMRWPPG